MEKKAKEAPILTTADVDVRKRPEPKPAEYVTTNQLDVRPADFENGIITRSHLERIGKKMSPDATRGPLLADLLAFDALADAPQVWIVGGGPSLKGFDWDLLRGQVVMGTNMSFDRPHVGSVVSIDNRFREWLYDDQLPGGVATQLHWADFPGVKVHFVKAGQRFRMAGRDVTYSVEWRSSGQAQFPPRMDCLFGETNNTGYAAFLLAWALGAKRIGLLGFDMQGDTSGNQAWHHEPYTEVQGDHVYDGFKECFMRAAKAVKEAGLEVVNFGDSALTCFPRQPLSEVPKWQGKTAKDKPMIIGYATEGSQYVAHAEEMARTAAFFGFDVRIEKTKDTGSWAGNTYQKAGVILEALERFNRPVVYLDADARIRRYPSFLDAQMADLSFVRINWANYGGHSRKDEELLTGAIGAKPTKAVKAFLRKWDEALREEAAGHSPKNLPWEQVVLDRLVSEGAAKGIKLGSIPNEYCWISNFMQETERPVIEQLQASRQLKGIMGG